MIESRLVRERGIGRLEATEFERLFPLHAMPFHWVQTHLQEFCQPSRSAPKAYGFMSAIDTSEAIDTSTLGGVSLQGQFELNFGCQK